MKTDDGTKDTKIVLRSPTYLSSARYVCFKCRVCFHKPYHLLPDQKCQNCAGDMSYAGSAFRAPRKQNVKAWALLEVMIRSGVTFSYCGGVGKLPATVNEAKQNRANKNKKFKFGRRTSTGKRVIISDSWGSGGYRLP